MTSAIQLHVTFAGQVQGVGFRYTTANVARGFDVTGYVRNLSDGRVELVAEGQPDEVRAFVAAVKQEMSSFIHDTQSYEASATGGYDSFQIQH